MSMKPVLPVIVISQFLCTSLWFAGNAVTGDIGQMLSFDLSYAGYLVSAVQFGFTLGTLLFALLSIADRFSPSGVFCICAILAATANLVISLPQLNAFEIVVARSLTGFFLAGIYPVGMKIASDHYHQKLGSSLGFLLGALVLGTAFPHLLKSLTTTLPWQYVIYSTSLLSVIGGILLYFLVPDGPCRHQGTKPHFNNALKGFRNKKFRALAYGYFGHQWEIYAFWVFVPMMLTAYQKQYPLTRLNIPFLSFMIIAIGSLTCVFSGLLSQNFGTKKTATLSLMVSGLCCLFSPFMLLCSSSTLFLGYLFVWGMAVVADSPLFSSMIALTAPPEAKGASITLVNCIGYSITIISIQLINILRTHENTQYIYVLLAIGPILGSIALLKRDSGTREA